ncbi:hypothetical protein GCK32_020651 [Trichostrongylus colubriformis]|uniref:Uncharacterized protein n=1 Tax=Trichostrongylus colubriformis TaxID=6319 RepID=A0AAN8IT19_TRICO
MIALLKRMHEIISLEFSLCVKILTTLGNWIPLAAGGLIAEAKAGYHRITVVSAWPVGLDAPGDLYRTEVVSHLPLISICCCRLHLLLSSSIDSSLKFLFNVAS